MATKTGQTNHHDEHTDLKTLDKVEQEEPEEGFSLLDWDLPAAFTDEVLASAALEHLKLIQTCEVNIIANRSVHNDAEANRLILLQSAAKRALVEIKRCYPGALKIVREVASHQALQARLAREAAISAVRG